VQPETRIKRGFQNILYIHLLTCIARCQKYCHESRKTTATHIWKPGMTSQYIALASSISQVAKAGTDAAEAASRLVRNG
jgi:hypothetical protein